MCILLQELLVRWSDFCQKAVKNPDELSPTLTPSAVLLRLSTWIPSWLMWLKWPHWWHGRKFSIEAGSSWYDFWICVTSFCWSWWYFLSDRTQIAMESLKCGPFTICTVNEHENLFLCQTTWFCWLKWKEITLMKEWQNQESEPMPRLQK